MLAQTAYTCRRDSGELSEYPQANSPGSALEALVVARLTMSNSNETPQLTIVCDGASCSFAPHDVNVIDATHGAKAGTMDLTTTIVVIAALLLLAAIVFVVGYRVGKRSETLSRREFEARSRSTMRGQIAEHFAPYLPDFPADLKASEARFIGKPVDFLVFKGMDEQNITELVFVEIKTGKARLTNTEKQVRSAIIEKKVRWHEYRTDLLSPLEAAETQRSD
jgi:hypothetical protein